MDSIENESLLHNTITNRIEVASVPAPDCVCGVTAMAINTLTDTRTRVITGYDIQQIVQETALPKGEFNLILDVVGKKFGIQDVVMTAVIDIPLDERQTYQLYTSLIDNGGLVLVAVNAKQWYQIVGYPGPIKEGEHSLLINGYQTKKNRYFGKGQSESVFIRDPNLTGQLLVPYDKLRRIMVEDLERHLIVFHNKNNQSIGEIQIPIP